MLKNLDEMIVSGQLKEASKQLFKISLTSVPREYRLPYARLFRRVGLLEKGIKVLYPVVLGELSATQKPSEAELGEYAVLISRMGCVDEALTIFEKISEKEVPEKPLYQGYCHISSWNFSESIPYLLKYKATLTSTYQKLVTNVNLALCEVQLGSYSSAEDRLKKNIEECNKISADRLKANSLELLGQIYLMKGSLKIAEKALVQATDILNDNAIYDNTLIKKWQAVLKSYRSKSSTPLLQFRQLAKNRGHYESIRDSDYYLCTLEPDKKIYDHLYAGTPYASYRKRLTNAFEFKPPTKYVIGGSNEQYLDLCLSKSENSLKFDQTAHRALISLTSDFYQPLSFGKFFSEVYPGEVFDIYSSPIRVRKLISRIREKLRQFGHNITISNKGGSLTVQCLLESSILVPVNKSDASKRSRYLKLLKQAFSKEFNANEASKVLSISKPSVLRFLKDERSKGTIEVEKRGVRVFYRLAG